MWMSRVVTTIIMAFIFAISVIYGCNKDDNVQIVDPSKVEHANTDNHNNPSSQLRISVGAMITPKEGYAYYREFLDYISAQLGQTVQYVDAENYEEIYQKLKRSELDGGFVCSGPYVDGKKEFGLELLAAPRAYGKLSYHAYIIVPVNSSANKLDDLKGKTFSFTDPLSNSGALVPEFMLTRKGASSKRFFGKIVFSGSHDKSIQAVADSLVDGASVDSLVWEYLNRLSPELTRKTRIIERSEPYAIPPFVVRPGLNPVLKSKLREILLNAHNVPEGKKLLDKMMIDRFEIIDDKAYDSIREMKRMTGKQ